MRNELTYEMVAKAKKENPGIQFLGRNLGTVGVRGVVASKPIKARGLEDQDVKAGEKEGENGLLEKRDRSEVE